MNRSYLCLSIFVVLLQAGCTVGHNGMAGDFQRDERDVQVDGRDFQRNANMNQNIPNGYYNRGHGYYGEYRRHDLY
jgi:hypothetical protein